MQLATILLARAIGHLELLDLDPRGGLYYPKFVKAIIERYQFQIFPKKPEDMDESNGVEFKDGIWDGVAIEEMILFTNGFQVDTRSSTHDSRRLVEEGLEWFRDHFGMVYSPSMIKRWAFISSFTFHSEMSMTSIHPAFKALAKKLTKGAAVFTERDMDYEVVSIQMTFDHQQIKTPI